ncbi:hypothetical protein [Bacteroides pyogenes]|uniref:hypothetical protein n=1 Tax=Bacteroides pyogenes TaxID=310300 RepID=UPI001BAC6A13|nr:hypothetical protein [Bacteroides pyogenes]MBR8726014.1 hypothetical protein [Bacteroides pyogenes]MBR8739294.1 hypothetical protein [Bacteroides pyogenes]MBR8755156.1 hypothetical protein [Bacteroides pyogenes]MBR8796502.1 hypothetical protein [Bacteroides pyogenes]MBR8810008.1 hypothetical protein [Bacteroides pyogenes]
MRKKTAISKNIQPNVENLPFTEYYQSIPDVRKVPRGTITVRQQLIYAISDLTGKSIYTIRRWVTGKIVPLPLEQEVIADLLKSDVETLFPEA